MSGLSRQDAEDACNAGWDQNKLLLISDYSANEQLQCHYIPNWGISVEDSLLFYKTSSIEEIELGFISPTCLGNVIAYCDGSGTIGNKAAGIGCVIYQHGAQPKYISQNIGLGSNNVAELCAIWAVLRAFPDVDQEILIKSDSQYAIGACTELSWNLNANQDLITNIRLDLAYRKGFVTFEHVDGHSDIEGNECADVLANMARKRIKNVTVYER